MRFIAQFIVFGLVAAHAAPGGFPKPTTSPAIPAFSKRIDGYVRLRHSITRKLPEQRSESSFAVIVSHERNLGTRIRAARAGARRGDLFTPEVAREFQRLINLTMERGASSVDQSLRSAEPIAFNLRVNATYPEDLPLQSMPPSLLIGLPRLPPELEYRIVGRSLILRDVAANIIIDFIPNIVPVPQT